MNSFVLVQHIGWLELNFMVFQIFPVSRIKVYPLEAFLLEVVPIFCDYAMELMTNGLFCFNNFTFNFEKFARVLDNVFSEANMASLLPQGPSNARPSLLSWLLGNHCCSSRDSSRMLAFPLKLQGRASDVQDFRSYGSCRRPR